MNKKFSLKTIFVVVFFLYFFQLSSSSLILFYLGKSQLDNELQFKLQRISEDISYQNDIWNISHYNKDPKLLGSYPLYLITNDGFVLDRRSTITGFLDSSDYKRLLAYQNIQTISTVTGQNRRIYSKLVRNNDLVQAVVTVSYFNPQKEILESIDKNLIKNADIITSQIAFKNGMVDVSRVDEKDVSYDISFIIVDNYNTILKKTTNVNSLGRIPNFIDPSYVKSQLLEISTRIISDRQTKEAFLVASRPIFDKNKTPLGVIVVGVSFENFINLFKRFLVLYSLASLVLYSFISYFIYACLKKAYCLTSNSEEAKKIYFDQKQGLLSIDDNLIEIPYATNQYYLLKELFSNPSKRWETDELLDKYGELKTNEGARKVYDTMVNINRKVEGYIHGKLIISQNKTFQLNPNLPVIKSSK